MLTQPWRITLFGGLTAQMGDHIITRFTTRKTAALLAFLALHRDRSYPREALTESFWPDTEPEAGRTSLRQALASLRRQLEPAPILQGSVLYADRSNVQLHPDALTTDTAEFEAAIKTAEVAYTSSEKTEALRIAVTLYQGELLPGFYEDWVTHSRERYAEMYRKALLDLATAYHQANEWEQALLYARNAANADSWDEKPQALLIQLLFSVNRPNEARSQYEEFARELRRSLHIEPSESLRALIAKNPAIPSPIRQVATTVSPPSREPQRSPAPAHPHLPVRLTRFFGRESEISHLIELLTPTQEWGKDTRTHRLVSLVGAGGSGKTRLAIEAADRIAPEYCHAVWFVSLADISDWRLLPDAIRDALRLPRTGNTEALDQIVIYLQGRPSLLLLDNLEHITAGGAAIIQTLLSRAFGLTCLVTSQRRLMLPGELVFPVVPLPVPSSEKPSPESLRDVSSVRLFVDRAQAVRPDFAVTTRNAQAVASLCAQLDGVPLALELAAAWAGALTPSQMLERLNNRFQLLRDRRGKREDRHGSLWATLEWSHRLLPAEMQRLFCQLSIFRGGWKLEAVEAICEESNALNALEQLREHSLVTIEESGNEMRYFMLATLREFGSEQWNEAEQNTLPRRHFAYFMSLAEEAHNYLKGADAAFWLDTLEAEHDNLRAALAWGQKHAPLDALKFACTLWLFWYTRGYLQEGQRWLEEGAQNNSIAALYRARAWKAAGIIARDRADLNTAADLCQRALEVFRAEASDPDLAETLSYLGLIATDRDDFPAANLFLREALEKYRLVQDDHGVARTLNIIGLAALKQDDFVRVKEVCEESLTLFRALDAPQGVAFALNTLGCAYNGLSLYVEAERLHEECLALQKELGSKRGIALSLSNLGVTRRNMGTGAETEPLFQEGLRLFAEIGDRWGIGLSLERLARSAYERNDTEKAGKLLGAAAAILTPSLLASDIKDDHDDWLTLQVRNKLGIPVFAEVFRSGKAMPLEDAVKYALHVFSDA